MRTRSPRAKSCVVDTRSGEGAKGTEAVMNPDWDASAVMRPIRNADWDAQPSLDWIWNPDRDAQPVARLDLESRQGCSNACRPGSDRGYPTVVPSRFGILTGIFSCPSVRSGSPIKWMNVPTQIPCSRHAKRNLELNEIVVRVLRFLVAVEALSSRFSFSCFAGREKACPPRRSSGRPGGLAPESRPLERSRGAGLRRPPSLARRAT